MYLVGNISYKAVIFPLNSNVISRKFKMAKLLWDSDFRQFFPLNITVIYPLERLWKLRYSHQRHFIVHCNTLSIIIRCVWIEPFRPHGYQLIHIVRLSKLIAVDKSYHSSTLTCWFWQYPYLLSLFRAAAVLPTLIKSIFGSRTSHRHIIL